MKKHISHIKQLVNSLGKKVLSITPMPSSGSPRQYFRIKTKDGNSFVGVFHPDANENRTHFLLTQHFLKKGFHVPTIYTKSQDFKYFILDDLGDTTLLKYLEENKNILPEDDLLKLFHRAIDDLLHFQIDGIKDFKTTYAYPVPEFNKRSIIWDLNYFKYSFIKTNELTFNENRLEDDFTTFAHILMQTNCNYFLYRDFQSRNIMLHNEHFWYIDFQGGRKGPLQYDLISLIYQAKAGLTIPQRDKLYNYYIKKLAAINPEIVADFEKYYSDFVLFRLIQVLGAYGFRGLFQRKPHFLESIYPAITTLKQQLQNNTILSEVPELINVLQQITKIKDNFKPLTAINNTLLVEINSFSYKKHGIPYDISPNGGGFVFDCRALPNPGRISELRNYTGKDKIIIDYFEQHKEITEFKTNVFNIVNKSINNYTKRHFTRLQVNFGCTGGRHRSVYMAEQLKKFLEKQKNISTIVKHFELENI